MAGGGDRVVYIDSKNGQFVTREYAEANPETTVMTTIKMSLEKATIEELVDELHRRYHL